MSEIRRHMPTLLLIAEIAFIAAVILPTWQRVALDNDARHTVIRLGLPFSPWITGTQVWSEAKVPGAWDYDGNVQIHLRSWSWLLLVLAVAARHMRRRLRRSLPSANGVGVASQPSTDFS